MFEVAWFVVGRADVCPTNSYVVREMWCFIRAHLFCTGLGKKSGVRFPVSPLLLKGVGGDSPPPSPSRQRNWQPLSLLLFLFNETGRRNLGLSLCEPCVCFFLSHLFYKMIFRGVSIHVLSLGFVKVGRLLGPSALPFSAAGVVDQIVHSTTLPTLAPSGKA